jgi:hypothetical protein
MSGSARGRRAEPRSFPAIYRDPRGRARYAGPQGGLLSVGVETMRPVESSIQRG